MKREKLREALALFGTEAVIELQGDRVATVQGSRGLIEYTESLIRISLGDKEARFFGDGLSLGCLNQDSLEIRGTIQRVEFV